MLWPTRYFFALVTMLAVTLAVSWGKSSNPMRSTEPTQSAKATPPAQPTQRVTADTAAGNSIGVTSEHQPHLASRNPRVQSVLTDASGEAAGSARFASGEVTSVAGNPRFTLEPRHHGSNHPPVMNSPITNFSRILLFPRGPPALVEFAGEPASDPEGDELTYRFAFALFGMTGIQTPEEALMRITRSGNSFEILPDGDITPAEFRAVYGAHASISGLPAAVYASDGNAESSPEVYNLDIIYDGSAQFSAPAEYAGDQRWEYPEPIDWYEGTSAPVDGAFPKWTGVTAGQRNWRLDRAPGTIRCEILTFTGFYSFEEGGEDNNLFAVASETGATTGTVRLSFNSPPDFETPRDENGDNTYRLRVVNTHDINNINLEGNPTGCNGSVLDFAIRVRDVGVPAPPGILSASYHGTPETGDTVFKIIWTEPEGFMDNDTLAPFPSGFEVTGYDYRYREAGTSAWTENTAGLPMNDSETVEGLTEAAYEVQVRGNNREGPGEWSEIVETGRYMHTVHFGSSRYTAFEGNTDRVEIEVRLDPPPLYLPVTVPVSVTEENGAGPEDYSGIPPGITFQPHESVKTFTVVSVSESDEREGRGESIRLTFADLPSNVTDVSPASATVILRERPTFPYIVGLRISSSPEHEIYYDRGETIEVEVEFSEPVEVMAKTDPYLWLEVDYPDRKEARYTHGTGTNKLYFQYRVRLHDLDTNGVGVAGGDIQLTEGSINAVATGMAADLQQNGLPDDLNHRIDGCL